MNTRDRRKEHSAGQAAPGIAAGSMSFPTSPHPFHPGCFLHASMSPLLVPGYCSGAFPYYQPCIISQQDGRRILIRQPVMHPFLRPSFGHPFSPSPSLLPYQHHMQTMAAGSMYTRTSAISKEVQTDTEDLEMGKSGEELLEDEEIVQKKSSAAGRHSGKVATVVNYMSNLAAQNHKGSSGFCSLPDSTEAIDDESKGTRKAVNDQLAQSTPLRQTKKPLLQREVDPLCKANQKTSGEVEEMRTEHRDVSVNCGGYSEREEKASLTCKKVEQVLARITDPLQEGSFEVWTIEATVPVYDAKSASDAQFDIPHCEVISVETCKGFVAMMDSVPSNASLTCQQVLGKLTSKNLWVVDSSSCSSSEEQQGPLTTKMSDKQTGEILHKQRVLGVWEGDTEQLRLAATIQQCVSSKDDRTSVSEMHSCPPHCCDACSCAESLKNPLYFEEVMNGSCPSTHDAKCDVAADMSCGNVAESFPSKLPRKSWAENGCWLEKVDLPNIVGAMPQSTQECTSDLSMSLERSSEKNAFENVQIRRQDSSGHSYNFTSPPAILGSEFVQSHVSHEVTPGNSKSYSEYRKPLIAGIERKTASPCTYLAKEHPQQCEVKNPRWCQQNAERYNHDTHLLSDSSACTSVSQVPCHKNDFVRESLRQLKRLAPLDVGSLKESRSHQPPKMRTKQKRESLQLGAVPKKTSRKTCEPSVQNVYEYQETDSSDSMHSWYDSTVCQSDKQKEHGNGAREWLEQVANGRALRTTRRRYCSSCGSLKLLDGDGECEHLLTRPSWERKSHGVRRSLHQQSIPRTIRHTTGRAPRPISSSNKRTVFHRSESPSRIEVELCSRDARRMYTRRSYIHNTSKSRNASRDMI
uniref:uncharacterized protein n=1 Tax=Myxine glutinosa TaxID=7769 RepID=UPI00358FF3CB